MEEENKKVPEQTPEQEVKKSPFESRIHEIDFLRGLLMCLVIIDHLFNLLMIFNREWCGGQAAIDGGTAIQPYLAIYQVARWYWTTPIRTVVRWLCLGSFVFIGGISCAFSRNNWRRAGGMIALWMAILVVSNCLNGIQASGIANLGVPYFRVDFNIIGVIAWSTLIYCFFEKKSWKWLLVCSIVGLALHPVCRLIGETNFGQNTYAPILWEPSEIVGKQADYMPLFPYIGLFFGGALLSRFTYANHRESYLKRYNWERPFCFIGRHSLGIYGSHFLILIGLFLLVGLFIR